MNLKLDLDNLGEQNSPYSKFDVGGLRHYIIIKKENKEAFLDEITQNYRKMVNDLLEEDDED